MSKVIKAQPTDDQIATILRLWPDTSRRKIATTVGCCVATLRYWVNHQLADMLPERNVRNGPKKRTDWAKICTEGEPGRHCAACWRASFCKVRYVHPAGAR